MSPVPPVWATYFKSKTTALDGGVDKPAAGPRSAGPGGAGAKVIVWDPGPQPQRNAATGAQNSNGKLALNRIFTGARSHTACGHYALVLPARKGKKEPALLPELPESARPSSGAANLP